MNGKKKSSSSLRRVCMLHPHGHVSYPPPLGETDTGGQTIYVLELSQALARRGVKVDIFTRRFGDLPEEEQVAEGVRIVRIPAGGPDFVQKEKVFEMVPEFVEGVIDYAKRKRKVHNLVHSHYWDGGYAGITLAKKLGVPHVHTPHSLGKLKKDELASVENLSMQKLQPAFRYHVRNQIEQKIMGHAQAVVVICQTSRIQVLQYYLVDFEKLKVIYPGVNRSIFNPRPRQRDKDIALSPNAILTMSRFVSTKGLDRLIDAARSLRGRVKFDLYMAGPPATEDLSDEERQMISRIKRQAAQLKLGRSLHFLGTVPHTRQLGAYYRQASVFVLPSRYEPFGLTTLEAMACGTVPIVSNAAGSKEVIVDGVNGFVVDAGDRQELADRIKTLLKKPDLRKQMRGNAILTTEKHYSWAKIVDEFINLYRSLI